jgi:uncharacterized membrane protein YkgB
MKKYLFRFWGLVILLSCGVSAGLFTIMGVSIVLNVLFARNFGPYYSDFVAYFTLAFPLLAWFFWSFNTDEMTRKVKRWIYYPEYED